MSETLNYNIVIGGNAYSSIGEIKKALKESNDELIAAQQNFGEFSQQAVLAGEKVNELKNAIQSAGDFTAALDPTKKFQAFSRSISGIAGGFAAVQGAIGLLGGESKELEKQLLKVQSALALSQGLQSISQVGKDFQKLGAVIQSFTIFQKANAAANAVTAATLRAVGVAAETSAIGFKVLKTAIVSTGIGILVIALGELVSALMNYTSAADKAKKKQEELNLVIANGEKEALKGTKAFIKSKAELDQLRVKSEGGTEEQIEAIRVKGIKDQILANNSKYETLLKLDKKAATELKEENATLQDELTKIELQGTINKNEKSQQLGDKKKEKDKQQKEKDRQQKEQDEKDELARQQAQADRESAAQQIQIDAFRSTLDKRQQDILAAEDDFEKKKGELIKAGVTDFTYVQEQYRIKLLEINKNYDKQEEDEAKKKKEIELSAIETNNERVFQTRKLEADTEAERFALELETLESDYKLKYDLAVKNGEDLTILDEYYAARKLEVNRNFAEEQKQIDKNLNEAKEAAVLSGLSLLSAAAGENEKISNIIFGIQKALEIGKIITSTAGAITAVTTSTAAIPPFIPPGIPNPVAISAAVIGAKKVATLKLNAAAQIGTIAGATISRFKGSTGGGISGSAPSNTTAPMSPQRPETQTTNLSAQTINDIGNSAIRAYVVETDITSNQKRVQAIKQRARFS